jgi:glycosyltransferase involved in cell wall biosynthesis
MKFSIIIPSQNRPELLAMAVHYALSQNYTDIELIVSDNSTTHELREQNRKNLEEYITANKLTIVSPPRKLSAPEHFEFALKYATGDYILFLSDKMMLLPDTLNNAANAIKQSGAEIVNWSYYIFIPDNYLVPNNSGSLYSYLNPLQSGFKSYDPLSELKFKASGLISRQKQSIESYVKGKICFGCYSKDLITRIISKSGGLFLGATHDYSAMVQALCLAQKAVILNKPGIVFFSLPVDKSLGSLISYQASSALKYYEDFTDSNLILSSLLVPGLYASVHNMVAHDYIKYLALYKKRGLFVKRNWLRSIGADLSAPGKLWSSKEERYSQYKLFISYLITKPIILVLYCFEVLLSNTAKLLAKKVMLLIQKIKISIRKFFFDNKLGEKVLNRGRERYISQTINKSSSFTSFDDAVKCISTLSSVK